MTQNLMSNNYLIYYKTLFDKSFGVAIGNYYLD